MNRILITLAALALTFTACGQNNKKEMKTLVAYFSATGTTEAVAKVLAEVTGGTLYEIKPEVKYTAADLDWRDANSRSSREMKDPEERPTIKQCTDITPYDTIYVGFPIWWGICPRIINSWIDNNLEQLKSKTLVPFATSGSSGIEDAVAYLRKTYPELKWEKGKLMNN